jgi:hypothetical protein
VIYFAIILALLGAPAFAATVEGRVVAIADVRTSN